VTVGGVLAVASVERTKITAQAKARILLAACVISPFAFAATMVVQSSVPSDTLFGRAVKESGYAAALVVLGFAALWIFPLLTSIVGGDVFSAEDRYGTWTTVMMRSRSRAELFAGKVLTALAFSLLAVTTLAMSSIAAGVIMIGSRPLIDLSGSQLLGPQAAVRVVLAWASVMPPALAFTALAVLLSVATRSSAAGIGLPVLAGLAMQLIAFVDAPEPIRRLLMTSGFEAWHGLLSEPPFYRPLVHGCVVSAAYFVIYLLVAYRLLRRRDIGG
jgi:ABC-2 type transport system permease protein